MKRTERRVRPLARSGRTWVVGGTAILLSVAAEAILVPLSSFASGVAVVPAVLFGVALFVFAFGIRGTGSITNRQFSGTAALVLLALSVLAVSAIDVLISSEMYGLVDARDIAAFTPVTQFALAVVAVAQIARSKVLPHPWNWAPSWALLAVSLAYLFQELSALDQNQATSLVVWASTADGAARLGAALFLGVLTIVLGARADRSTTVPIMRSIAP